MIELKNISKSFSYNGSKIDVLKDVNLSLPDTGLFFLVGKSGEGKSTLLNIIGGILSQTSGEIFINGEKVSTNTEKDLCDYRRENVSFVFQNNNLINEFSVKENLLLSGCDDNKKIDEVLEIVSLKNNIYSKVSDLSGGEKQRLAIARGLLKKSAILLLDEPTGSLDQNNAKNVFDVIKKVSKYKLVLVVSHDMELADTYADDIFVLSSGNVTKKEKISEITIENLDFSDDKYFELCNIIFLKKISQIRILCEGKKEIILIERGRFYDSLKQKLSSYQNKKVCIFIEEHFTNDKNTNNVMLNDKDSNLPKKACFRYALNLFVKHLFRSIMTIVCFSLCMVLLFIQSSLMLSDKSLTINRCLQKNGIEISSIYRNEENLNLGVSNKIYRGRDFYIELKQSLNDSIFVGTTKIIENTKMKIYCLEDKLTFNNIYLENLKDGVIYTTSFAHDYIGKKDEIEIEGRDYKIESILDEYDSNLYAAYSNNKASSIEIDVVENKFFVCFVSMDTFKELQRCDDSFSGYNLSFDGKINFSERVYYRLSNLSSVDFGTYLIKDNGIIITTSYAKKYLNSIFEGEDYDSLIGEKISIYDIKKSPNYISHKNEVNMSNIYSDVVITGIINSNSTEIYISEDFLNRYNEEYLYSGIIGFYCNNEVNLKKSVDKGYLLDMWSISLIENIYSLLNSDFIVVLIIAEVVFALISILFLVITCINNINENIKQISIIKSMGIRNNSIERIFDYLNGIIVFISLIIGVVLSIVSVWIVNEILQRENVLNLNYDFFSLNWMILLLIIGVAVIFVLVLNLFTMRKIKKVDLVDYIKQ